MDADEEYDAIESLANRSHPALLLPRKTTIYQERGRSLSASLSPPGPLRRLPIYVGQRERPIFATMIGAAICDPRTITDLRRLDFSLEITCGKCGGTFLIPASQLRVRGANLIARALLRTRCWGCGAVPRAARVGPDVARINWPSLRHSHLYPSSVFITPCRPRALVSNLTSFLHLPLVLRKLTVTPAPDRIGSSPFRSDASF